MKILSEKKLSLVLWAAFFFFVEHKIMPHLAVMEGTPQVSRPDRCAAGTPGGEQPGPGPLPSSGLVPGPGWLCSASEGAFLEGRGEFIHLFIYFTCH